MTLSGGLNSSAKYLARFACTVIMNCKQNFLSKRQKYLVRNLTQFVPQYNPPCQKDKDDFSQFLRHYDNILVLTGAGISTESGIPDYRSEGVGVYNRTTYKPINYTTFLNDRSARIRYWARNYIGWPKFSSAVPNKTHFSLVELECTPNKISTIITQNVDGLHHKAGSSKVIELHGNAYWVQCLQCKNLTTRHDFQRILDSLNPNLKIITTTTRPDGDTDVDKVSSYRIFYWICTKA